MSQAGQNRKRCYDCQAHLLSGEVEGENILAAHNVGRPVRLQRGLPGNNLTLTPPFLPSQAKMAENIDDNSRRISQKSAKKYVEEYEHR